MNAGLPAVKPLRRAGLWLAVWWLAVTMVVVVCLIPPPPIPVPPGGDKLEHFLAYFLLTGSAVQVYRRGWPLLWAGLGLVALGGLIELAQGALTTTRAADPMDALANGAGVLAGLAIAVSPLRDLLLHLEPRVLR